MNRDRRAFTIVELMVVAAGTSLLMALLLPAIQDAREAAWRLTCKSRLRALAAASQMYHDVHGTLPAFLQMQVDGESAKATTPSIHSRLLPFLELAPVADMINWDLPLENAGRALPAHDAAFATVRARRISHFLCPTDSHSKAFAAGVSYRGNVGVGPLWHQTAVFPDSANGPFAVAPNGGYPLTLSRVFDGLANTAFWSERLLGASSALPHPTARDAFLQPGIEWLHIHTADDQLRVCAALGAQGVMQVFWTMGGSWLTSGQHYTLYTHAFSPNSGVIDCIADAYSTPLGTASARSQHEGIVHVAFGDGSVRALSDDVALIVWRALGTRNGGEVGVGGAL